MKMMNDNLARQISPEKEINPIHQPSPKVEKQPRKVHIEQPERKLLTRAELIVVSFFATILLVLAVIHIALSMQVSTTNRAIQDIQSQSTIVQVENDNYEQKVQELSRYDRVYSIAKKHDLNMNEDQIRNVLK